MYKLENYNNHFLTFSAISLLLRSRNFSVNLRKMFLLSIFLQPHLLKFGHRLGINRRHFWLMFNNKFDDLSLVFFQFLVGFLPPRVPVVPHFPLVHLCGILAANGVNSFVSN